MQKREANTRFLLGHAPKSLSVSNVMMKHVYIGNFEITDDHRTEEVVVNLTGMLNKHGLTRPRFDVQLKDQDKWQKSLLLFLQFGFLVLTTSAGMMDHEEARHDHTGGKTLEFFF